MSTEISVIDHGADAAAVDDAVKRAAIEIGPINALIKLPA